MRIAKFVLVMVLSALLALVFVGCSTQAPDTRVAATVNGTDIMEGDVTARIESLRVDSTTGDPLDDAAWATLLKNNNFTPETLREYVIRNEFGFYILFLQKAAAVGITPDETSVDSTLASVKSNVTSSGGTFDDYLKSMGLTSEDSYRRMLEANDIKDEAVAKLLNEQPPTQDEIDTYISQNAATYAGKRLSLIVLATDSTDPTKTEAAVKAQADAAHKELEDGTDFATVAAKYMSGTQLGDSGGDLGWGYESYAPQEVQDALKTLKKNQISDVIEVTTDNSSSTDSTGSSTDSTATDTTGTGTDSTATDTTGTGTDTSSTATDTSSTDSTATDGSSTDSNSTSTATTTTSTFYIVKYTDEYKLTDKEKQSPVDVKKVPADLVKTLTDDYTSQKEQTDENTYFTDLAASDEIVVNPMPTGLSYDVDMSLATTDTSTDNSSSSSTTSTNPFDGETVPTPTYDSNGLGISDMLVGTGAEVKSGDMVEVNYIGYLEDGTAFDNSFDRGQPLSVTVGAGQVIKGWDLGLVGMKVGGHRELIIPPDLAYGSAGSGSTIPPNATLRFDIELVSVNGDSTGYTGSTDTSTGTDTSSTDTSTGTGTSTDTSTGTSTDTSTSTSSN